MPQEFNDTIKNNQIPKPIKNGKLVKRKIITTIKPGMGARTNKRTMPTGNRHVPQRKSVLSNIDDQLISQDDASLKEASQPEANSPETPTTPSKGLNKPQSNPMSQFALGGNQNAEQAEEGGEKDEGSKESNNFPEQTNSSLANTKSNSQSPTIDNLAQREAVADQMKQQKQNEKARNQEAPDKANRENIPENSAASGREDLRQRKFLARREAETASKAEMGKNKTGSPSSLKNGTNLLLRSAWEAMATVVGFFPGLLYINLHVFCHWVLGDQLFSSLGQEWDPFTGAERIAPGRKDAYGELAESLGKSGKIIGLMEIIALLILDLAVFCCVLAILTWISFIAYFIAASWLEKLKILVSAGWGTLKVIYKLFN